MPEPTPFTESRLDWVKARWKEGCRITSVAGDEDPADDKDGWILVMTLDSGLNEQVIVGPGKWPWQTIADKMRGGFAVTGLTGDVFVRYLLVPLLAGLILPYFFLLTDKPFASLSMRLTLLAATSGVSFLIAIIPAFLLLKTRILKKKPSHVFFFLMESIEYDLVENPDLEGVAPDIKRFAEEGITVPHFSASSGQTIDAVHTTFSGVSVQLPEKVKWGIDFPA